jgi:hypothetical protein
MRSSKCISITALFCSILLFSETARCESFFTSFEFSDAGTFSIGDAPFTASFAGGRAQTVGVGAYYHSGRFSWHVPSGGFASVSFETPVESVDFWFRDTAGAVSSAYRIFDTLGAMIGSGRGGQSFVNVMLARSDTQSRIARLEFDSAGGGDSVVDDFGYTVTANPPVIDPGGITRDEATAIARLYAAAFDRFPKLAGLNFWIDSYESGKNLVDIARQFVDSPEFVDKYGQLDNPAYVGQLFRNILGREAAETGVNFWKIHLNNGVSRAKVLSQLSESPENKAKTSNYDLREGGDGDWIFCTTQPEMCLD